ncbi:MAG: hypothetical protein KGM98_04230 [Bacteroidota bacterium]|nr:hypothetical protein [Bacteroidota bacterium]
MKTVNISKENTSLLSMERFLYFFQVLSLGFFIPFLFVYGITSKKITDSKDQVVKEISSDVHHADTRAYPYPVKDM